ncbi:MAG: metal-dependent phosphohydrolase [Pseudomonadota bacterium]
MFNSEQLVIDAFVEHIGGAFTDAFPNATGAQQGLLRQATRGALELLAKSDAAYHDVQHSILVTDVGQTILWGRISSQGDLSPEDWLHAVLAMLYHDVGYLRGALADDRAGSYLVDKNGGRVEPPPGATDAFMSPYHVERSRMYVEQRFARETLIDAEVISAYIEITRFPVPADANYQRAGDLGGLVRAADLIGQLADPNYLQKLAYLFAEFKETGDGAALGYQNAGQLRRTYPAFFYEQVRPYISEGLRYLRRSTTGNQWVAQLYSHVYTEQHNEPSFGPERGAVTGEDEVVVVALPNRSGG